MPMPDRVNDIYPLRQFSFNVTNDGLLATTAFLKEFRDGFLVLYSSPLFTDGTHTMTVKNEFGNIIPPDRFLFPQVVKTANPTFEPTIISPPGGMIDSASGIARMFSILDHDTDEIIFEIVSQNVTTGAVILVQLFAYPQRTPTQQNHIP